MINLIHEPNTISVYIHYPYCIHKCPYCDFNSYVAKPNVKIFDAYINEIKKYSKELNNKTVKSIFFGGGTPSLMEPTFIEKIINEILKLSNNNNNVEVSLEVNPSTVEINKFKNFKVAGVNRISIGIQSFNDNNLKFLQRTHSKEEALKAIKVANSIFNNVSFDLINALPEQTLNEWLEELKEAISFVSSHLSIYQLTIEKGTKFFKQNIKEANEDKGEAFYIETLNLLSKHNILPYEISNYSFKGKESIHNLNYWRGGLYIGIGAGAHGRILCKTEANFNNIIATSSLKHPDVWLNNSLKNLSTSENIILSKEERIEELLISNLRLFEPISDLVINNLNIEGLNFLVEHNLLEIKNNKYYTTLEGKLKLNSLISFLVNYIN